MKIAAYGIAKNEEYNIVKWYESVKDSDHILLLDTGSTDRTIEIAKELGIEVVQAWFSPWDETAAKNTALSLIPLDYDYCLNIDIDQVIVTSNWREIVEKNPEYVTYSGNIKITTGLGAENVHQDLTFIHQRGRAYWFGYRPTLAFVNDFDLREKYFCHLDVDIIDLPGTQERFNNREDLYIESFANAIEKSKRYSNKNMLNGMYINLAMSYFEKENTQDTLKHYIEYLKSINNNEDITFDNFLDFVNITEKAEVIMLLAVSLFMPQHTNIIYEKILKYSEINEYWKFFISLRKCIIYLMCDNLNKLKNEFAYLESIQKTSYTKDYGYNEFTKLIPSESEKSAIKAIKLFIDNYPNFNKEDEEYIMNLIFGNIHYGKFHPEMSQKCLEYFKKEGF